MAEREPTANPVARADVGGCGGNGATPWTALHHEGTAHGLHAVEEAVAVGTEAPRQPAFLELLAATGPVECVVELESAGGKMRVSTGSMVVGIRL